MRLMQSVSAVVLVLGLAGTVIVFATHADPRRPIQLAQAAPAAAVRPAAGAPAPLFQPPPDSAIPDND